MPSEARTRYKGRTTYQPSDQDRKMVARMVGVGILQDDICAVLDITVPTLHKHFARELATAYVKLLTRMRYGLVRKADEGDTKALIFYNMTHGWNQRLTVIDGGTEVVDPATLSDADLEARIARLSAKGKRKSD